MTRYILYFINEPIKVIGFLMTKYIIYFMRKNIMSRINFRTKGELVRQRPKNNIIKNVGGRKS